MSLACTNRVHQSCDGLEHKPLGIHLQGVLVGSLEAVKHRVLVAVHRRILQTKQKLMRHRHHIQLRSTFLDVRITLTSNFFLAEPTLSAK